MAARINIGYGEVEIESGYYTGVQLTSAFNDDVRVELDLPDIEDPDDLATGATVNPARRYSGFNEQAAAALLEVLTTAHEIQAQVNDANSGAAERAERAIQEREEQAARDRQAREAALAERKDRLMMEFVGETVKIRERSYKGMRTGVLNVIEEEVYNYDLREYEKTGEFIIKIAWRGEPYTSRIDRWKRLDVKVGARWMTLWDDGDDDLSEYDRQTPVSSAKAAPMYDGALA